MKNAEAASLPAHSSTALQHAQRHYQAGQYRACLDALQPLLAQPVSTTLKPALSVLRMAGACWFNLGQPAQAAQMFAQVTQRTSAGPGGDVQDWLNLASALDEAKQYPKAEAAYVQALKRKPGFTPARVQYCALLRMLADKMRHRSN